MTIEFEKVNHSNSVRDTNNLSELQIEVVKLISE